MNINDFSYGLPEELIGQEAIEPRDSCKLLYLDKATGDISHFIFRDLENILSPDHVLVLNDTKVFPARLFGHKESGGKIEVLLLKQISPDSYECIVRGHIKTAQIIIFGSYLTCEVVAKKHEGIIIVKFNISGTSLLTKIDELGKTPLPPYIHSDASENELRQKYQTVYAKENGSAAAPTAGLHFTEHLIERLRKRGIEMEKITLHVGLGTFKPVSEEQILSKTLHTESFSISHEVADRLTNAKRSGKKIIAVGTTSCRALETMADENGNLLDGAGDTNIFIQPGYRYKFVDGLITNFHLPKTSLLMLVSALVSFPNSPIRFENFSTSPIGRAYQEAIKNKYRFFSFGDAMVIL